MKPGPHKQNGNDLPRIATVVLVGFPAQDEDFLRRLFDCAVCPLATGCRFAVDPQASAAATLTALRDRPVPVVLCDRDVLPEAWKELLAEFAHLPEPPSLIVTSRLADDYLWAEALNLGAYDVLARPFDSAEVIRSVSLARMHWASGFLTEGGAPRS